MLPETYNQLLSESRPSNVVLRACFVSSARRNFTMRSGKAPTVQANAEWELRGSQVLFTHTYLATIEDEASDESLLSLQVTFEVALTGEQEYSEEFAAEYASRQLHIVTRPYFREFVFNMAPRALLQVPPVPTQFIPPRGETVEAPKPKRKPSPRALPK
jgi:hypothetical protein